MSSSKTPEIRIYEAPETEPISLAEAKSFLRVDISDDDTLIGGLIKTATNQCELSIDKSLITKKYKLSLYEKMERFVVLPHRPIQSIESITKYDEEGDSDVVSSGVYNLDTEKGQIVMEQNLYDYKIEVIYTAGYGVASAVPDDIKHALLIHIAKMYDDRNGYSPIPKGALAIYNKYRNIRL
jgi:uncharacterized phiE125 gp8 family phage protein